MSRLIIFFCILGCVCSFGLCAQEDHPPTSLPFLSESEEPYFQTLIKGDNRFAFELYQHLKNQPGNLFFSPYSIISGLNMVSIGVKGETTAAFQRAFHYSLNLLLFVGDFNQFLENSSASKTDQNASQMMINNGLWLDKSVPILHSFKQTLQRNFRTEIQVLDFVNQLGPSIQKINQWVLQKTNKKMTQILFTQDVTINTKMLLITAAYMKAKWRYPFDQKLTKRLPFHISLQRNLLVEMMQNIFTYLIRKDDRWDILVLPYASDPLSAQLAMAILLPKKGISLQELEQNLTPENWQQWKEQLKLQKLAVSLPRFHIEKRIDLETTLKALHLSFMFSPQADFSDMTKDSGVFLNKALHKTVIQVDEKGLEIEGISQEKITSEVKTAEVEDFIVDHPFIFIIWDQKTDAILFMGRLLFP